MVINSIIPFLYSNINSIIMRRPNNDCIQNIVDFLIKKSTNNIWPKNRLQDCEV